MKKFVIERTMPGAGNLTQAELQFIAQTSVDVALKMGVPYTWVESYITEDKIYCIHMAENEETIRMHARLAKIPINTVAEVKAMINPATSKTNTKNETLT